MKVELQEGLKAIATHQKLIKVANCSKYGWMTVDEYGIDQLASNSNYEKHLVKAEKSTERIVMQKRGAMQHLAEKEVILNRQQRCQLLQLSKHLGSQSPQDRQPEAGRSNPTGGQQSRAR